jgi:hypothetical protein
MFIAGPVGVEDGSIAPPSLAAARPMGFRKSEIGARKNTWLIT